MKVTPTELAGVLVIEPQVFTDTRGFFLETFNEERFAAHGLPLTYRQDNRSRSHTGVLRGLHYQLHHPQGKLIMAMRGSIYDVAVDIRRGSPTFGRWTSVELHEDQPRMLWIPPGFAHGFCVLSDVAEVIYKCTDVYHPGDERGVLWCDPRLAIAWPLQSPRVSERDGVFPVLTDDRDDLPSYAP